MALTVRVRPNAASLSFLLLGAALIVIGAMSGGVLGLALVVWGAVFAVLLGYPVAASTLLRVPAVVVGPDGIRLPLMGVRLEWPEIAEVRPGVKMRGRTQTPVLLVVPTDPVATVSQARWWLRWEARNDLASLGAPVVIDDRSLDHTLTEIRSAVSAHAPAR
ncbi:hypothetical protein [Micromonospora cremea]|uniref:PH domain-containing protein n=1 Tax=Micromonospora cremea TaxID=709881 RepID=A0A1N5TK57_9ACTN|nr:hypothetical protein [Micromonospora cremea]SIM48791.1 hypothetical protein SAMN04489832_0221 [Micromonospora cremea]